MVNSQNGWPVFTSPPSGVIPGYITRRVRPNDVDVIFTYLCERFDREVENIRQEWSWGWANRVVRGASSISNHASATAIDINAPAHPLGVTGTFSQAEKDRVHAMLRDLEGVVRWGEDYSGRKDGMHFEINAEAARVAAVARKILNGDMPDQKPDWKPKKAKAVNFGRVQEQFYIAAGVHEGEIKRLNGVGLIQRALNKVDNAGLTVDGECGPATLNAWGRYEDRVGGLGRPRIPDRTSVEELAEAAGLRLVNVPWDAEEVEPEEPTEPTEPQPEPRKSKREVAAEILEGLWGNGDERREKLEAAGYNYDKVQAEVVKLLEQ